MANLGHEVYFITNRMGIRAKHQTEIWLYSLGMNYPTVIVTGDKLPILRSLGVNFFVDDRYETIMEVAEAKLPLKLYLRQAPYNYPRAYPDNVRQVLSVA